MAHSGSAQLVHRAGLGNVGSYQVSGIPWVSGNIDAYNSADSLKEISFPSVTSWVVVSNNTSVVGQTCRVGFSKYGCDGTSGNYYLEVPSGSVTPRLEVKVSQIFLSGSGNMSVMAGLTGIQNLKLDNENISPNGTNWSGSLSAQVG
tara:strand:- start:523 stop:963 length:441 start_codon:yes stop_codon:yes gene_type:complete